MCKAEKLWKQVEAFRRQKMTQDEIDSALMEYIGGLEKQRDELLRALEYSIKQVPELASVPGISEAIASVKGDS